MTARYDYTGILEENPTPRTMFGPPRNAVASKKLMRIIEDAQRVHETPESFADWLADYMTGYERALDYKRQREGIIASREAQLGRIQRLDTEIRAAARELKGPSC